MTVPGIAQALFCLILIAQPDSKCYTIVTTMGLQALHDRTKNTCVMFYATL